MRIWPMKWHDENFLFGPSINDVISKLAMFDPFPTFGCLFFLIVFSWTSTPIPPLAAPSPWNDTVYGRPITWYNMGKKIIAHTPFLISVDNASLKHTKAKKREQSILPSLQLLYVPNDFETNKILKAEFIV